MSESFMNPGTDSRIIELHDVVFIVDVYFFFFFLNIYCTVTLWKCTNRVLELRISISFGISFKICTRVISCKLVITTFDCIVDPVK